MGRLAELTAGDAGRVVLRYRPVLATVGAIVAIAFLVPGRGGGPGAAELAGPAAAAWPPTTSPSSVTPDAGGPGRVATPVVAPRLPTPPRIPVGAVTPVASGTVAPTTPTTVAPPNDQLPEPLRVESSAWASSTAGTPVAVLGVPDGTLPVGTRLGQVDKASFVRVAGSATVLTLTEDPEGGRTTVGDPAVKACIVAAEDMTWEPGEAMAFDDAPSWDPNSCVTGTWADDGSWAFDLGSVASPTDEAGFALVPTADAPLDFQVAFRLG